MAFIILDRDGVINFDSDDYIKSPEEWHPIPGSLDAIAHLNRAGFTVFIVSNQSGLARGLYHLGDLQKIHDKMQQALALVGGHIEEIFFCPHHPDEHCACRKPQPGLFHQIQAKYAVDLREVFYIGDKKTDVDVAKAVGCKPLLVLTGKGTSVLAVHPELTMIPHFSDLNAAVQFVLQEKQHEK